MRRSLVISFVLHALLLIGTAWMLLRVTKYHAPPAEAVMVTVEAGSGGAPTSKASSPTKKSLTLSGKESLSSSPVAASSNAIAGGVSGDSLNIGGAGDGRASYEQVVLARLNRSKRYPAAARERGAQGRATVFLRINRRGDVVEHALRASSGDADLDREALAMIRRAAPFPVVPDFMRGESFDFVVPIVFRLE